MLSLKSIFVSSPRPPSMPGRGNYWKLNPGVTIQSKRPRKRRLISHGQTGSRPQTLLALSSKSESSSPSLEDFDDESVFRQVYTLPTTQSNATPYNFCQETAATPLLRFSPLPPPSTLPFIDQSSLILPLPLTPYFSYFSEVRYPDTCEGDNLASHIPSEIWWGQMQSPGLLPNLDLNSCPPPSDFHGLPRTIRFPFPPGDYAQWCNFHLSHFSTIINDDPHFVSMYFSSQTSDPILRPVPPSSSSLVLSELLIQAPLFSFFFLFFDIPILIVTTTYTFK